MSRLNPQQTSQLVAAIVNSYRENQTAVSMESVSQPRREVIVKVIFMLRELLFPEYFGQRQLISTTIEYHIGDLLINLHRILHEQIVLALTHQAISKDIPLDDVEAQASEIIYRFLDKIPALRKSIELDIQAAFDGDPAATSKDEVMFSYPGVFAVSVYRMAHELQLLAVPLIPRIMTEYAHSVTGIDIHPGAAIGKYFFIDHGTGVVIGETTSIGNNVKVYQGVTLGALSTREGQNLRGVKRHPTIEDDVTVYSGTSILGGETVIGKGVVIGSNVFLTRSVPAGTKVSLKAPDLVFKGQSGPGADSDLDI
ncbi:MAG TPA: serine acetyltransferase [Syntrophomonas sp.]|nr:serine acetyltransferase [Syntrophomonas sp.]HRW12611.1 serine acetyltransferase [Syntrophomonas sp.]